MGTSGLSYTELAQLSDNSVHIIADHAQDLLRVLRPRGTKAVDAALLQARALVPEPMRPGWPEALRLRASRLPPMQ